MHYKVRLLIFLGISVGCVVGLVLFLRYIYFNDINASLYARDYDTNFDYPLQGNIVDCATALLNNRPSECPVINEYNYNFIIKHDKICDQQNVLVIMIKSAISHVESRDAIRKSWGQQKVLSEERVRRIFILGTDGTNGTVNSLIEENARYGDILLVDFQDDYRNLTIKTMMSFKWAVEYCASSKHYLLCDDDVYISVVNMLQFLANPYTHPACHGAASAKNECSSSTPLYAGYIFDRASPFRDRRIKWYVSLKDYPYNLYPPFASGTAYVLSRETLSLMYHGSFFTRHFWIEDVYIGVLAKKMNIQPFHCSAFNAINKLSSADDLKDALSAHSYTAEELATIWSMLISS